MSHNMYYTKFPVPLGENSEKTLFSWCVYYSDTSFFPVRKYEKDNMWWYSIQSSGEVTLNSIAFNSRRNMSDSLRADMRALGLRPNQSWTSVRVPGRCEND